MAGGGSGIVGADDLDGATVAGTIFFNDNDAVVGLLACAYARQTDHQHSGVSFQKLKMEGRGRGVAVGSAHSPIL